MTISIWRWKIRVTTANTILREEQEKRAKLNRVCMDAETYLRKRRGKR